MKSATLIAAAFAAVLVTAAPAAADRHGDLQVGPGPVRLVLPEGRYRVALHLTPNHALHTGTISVAVRDGGQKVRQAEVSMTVRMLDMNMGSFTLGLHEAAAGTYTRTFPVVGMAGRWQIRLSILPKGGNAFAVTLADRMLG